MVSTPDVAYLLNVDPVAARARKPEYPVDFLIQCRQAYFHLAKLLGTMTVIPPVALLKAMREVERRGWRRYFMPRRQRLLISRPLPQPNATHTQLLPLKRKYLW